MWCMLVPGFTPLTILLLSLVAGGWCAANTQGRAQGCGRAGIYGPPPMLTPSSGLGAFERHIGSFRLVALHWQWSTDICFPWRTEMTTKTFPLKQGYSALLNIGLGMFKGQILKLDTSAGDLDFYCSWLHISMATYFTVISQQSLELYKI